MSSLVHVEQPAPGVGMVLLDDPPKNFGSYALLQALHDALGEVRSNGAKVVVLASDVPGYLMAHAWLPDVLRAYEQPDQVTGNPLLWRMVAHELERGEMVSISCNHGQAWGGGAELSWACNLRTAGESATYAQIESILGVIPGGGGTVRLARLVGQSKAMEILLAGEPMTAGQLADLGLVNKVFPDDELRERTIEWAAMIATRPKRSLQACKRGVLQTWDLDSENALRLEGYIFNSCMRPETLEIMRDVQDGYDRGDDSWEVYGLRRGSGAGT
jgi:enoyl-CoA hydratase